MIRQATSLEALHICKAVKFSPSADFKALLQVDSAGDLAAIVGYDSWTINAVHMHIWIPKWIGKEFIREAFRYTFDIAGKGLAIGGTPAHNAAALEFNRRVGFRETYRIKDGWALGTDMVIQEMQRRECRWILRSDHYGHIQESKEDRQEAVQSCESRSQRHSASATHH